jgi:hypothetical protein
VVDYVVLVMHSFIRHLQGVFRDGFRSKKCAFQGVRRSVGSFSYVAQLYSRDSVWFFVCYLL